MMSWATLLVIAILLPAAGALLMVLVPPLGDRAEREFSRWLALGIVLVTFLLSAVLVAAFPSGADEFASTRGAFWFGFSHGPVEVQFLVGLDGLSLWMFGLTSLLMLTSIGDWPAELGEPCGLVLLALAVLALAANRSLRTSSAAG